MKKLLIILLLGITLISCSKSPQYEYTIQIEHCTTRDISIIKYQDDDHPYISLDTYDRAVPILFLGSDKRLLNICDYKILSKRLIK